jgi:hypothetical protein
MFYTGCPSYNFIPTEEQCLQLKQKGRNVAIFQSPDVDLPVYITNDTSVLVIKKELKGWE